MDTTRSGHHTIGVIVCTKATEQKCWNRVEDCEIHITSESNAYIHVDIWITFIRGLTSFGVLASIVLKIEILDLSTFLRRLVYLSVSMSVNKSR